MQESSRLTTNKYWNDQYDGIALKKAVIVNPGIDLSTCEIDKFLKKNIPTASRFKFIEVGCAPGGWMHYFHKNFSFEVEGIEYTSDGVVLTKSNLKLLNVESTVHEGDLFDNKLIKGGYDVVFSAGFIEHFNNPSLAIEKHLELLKKKGYLILMVPNLRGFNRIYQSICDDSLLRVHNLDIMNLDYFGSLASRFNLKSVKISYVGIVNLGLFQGRKVFRYFGYMVQFLFNKIYFLFGKKFFIKDMHSLSPYIIAVYIKK